MDSYFLANFTPQEHTAYRLAIADVLTWEKAKNNQELVAYLCALLEASAEYERSNLS